MDLFNLKLIAFFGEILSMIGFVTFDVYSYLHSDCKIIQIDTILIVVVV